MSNNSASLLSVARNGRHSIAQGETLGSRARKHAVALKGRHSHNALVGLQSTLACLAIICCVIVMPALAEEPAYLGATRCIDCHTQPSPLRVEDGVTDWVKLTEAHTWLEIDKHSLAFKVLESDDSTAIGKRLGIDVTHDRRCLSCHAGWSAGPTLPPRRDLGVSCEACHGPSSLYDLPHTDPGWRSKTPNEEATGMVDVREPRRRAELCLSCHVGNVAEEKVLTHDMYAAGHPPLPGFEVATFAQAMPPHWRRLSEKGDVIRQDAVIRRAVHERAGDVPEVKSVVIGGVVGLRESVRLFRDRQAKADEVGGWPDFAQYDCSACHHELERPSWRQQRQQPGRPGQLFPPVWPTMLAELGLRHFERRDAASAKRLRHDFEQGLAALLAATRGEMRGASESLGDKLDELLGELDDVAYDDAAAAALLRDICELGQRRDLDFDSARQLGWAFQTIYLAAYGKPEEHQPIAHFSELNEMLSLHLPSTRKEQILTPARQKSMFDAIADYQPSAINARFGALAKSLPK